jgi:hypothetical protein
MDSSENILTKCCITCKIIKTLNQFVNGRNLCKDCRNKKTREDYNKLTVDIEISQKCNVCNIIKSINEFYKGRKICCLCSSSKKREKYSNDEEYRKRVIKETLKCRKGKPETQIQKIKRRIKSGIFRYLETKSKRTFEYLGCSGLEYSKWLLDNDKCYTFENYGKEWHIDHVIPLSKFDITNEEEQLLAFNWRNTMPLSVKENLKKSNKIMKEQIEQHLEKLKEYHIENKLDLPQVFINLFAKHLDDGEPLKLSLPL